MSESLVVCIDGTWNAPGQQDRDPISGEESSTETNVARTWRALTGKQIDSRQSYGSIAELTDRTGWAIYLNGVGSIGSKVEKLYEGASGTGTSERIRDAYRFLAERWSEDCKVYGFGFSRGAFAVRSLFGLVEAVGMPKNAVLIKDDELSDIYKQYKEKKVNPMPAWHRPCRLEFLGIWDTVGALAFGRNINDFHRVCPKNVKHVYHALALDETRAQFFPVLYQSGGSDQFIQETWFAGAHSNVGGGYCDQNLSNIALFWILSKAYKSGLPLSLGDITGWNAEDVGGIRRPSYDEFWGTIPVLGPIIEKLELSKVCRTVLSHQYVHESVIEAIEKKYMPSAITDGQSWSSKVEPWGV